MGSRPSESSAGRLPLLHPPGDGDHVENGTSVDFVVRFPDLHRSRADPAPIHLTPCWMIFCQENIPYSGLKSYFNSPSQSRKIEPGRAQGVDTRSAGDIQGKSARPVRRLAERAVRRHAREAEAPAVRPAFQAKPEAGRRCGERVPGDAGRGPACRMSRKPGRKRRGGRARKKKSAPRTGVSALVFLEQFQEKWKPVLSPELRQDKEITRPMPHFPLTVPQPARR